MKQIERRPIEQRRLALENETEKEDAEKTEVTDLPFRVNNVQRACLYLRDWQRENCGQLGTGPNARRCGGGCEMPSVGMVEIGAGVRHNAAQRARKRIKARPASKCFIE